MKLVYSSKKFGGFLLAFSLMFGIITVASSTAQAQYPWWERDSRGRRVDTIGHTYGLQVARERGYGYGLSVGAADAQRGQSYSPQRSRYWKRATEGYKDSFDNKRQYKQAFRTAFEQGYREGYQRFANNRRDRWNRWPR